MQATEFKVSLIGESGSGKSAFVEKLLLGQSIIHDEGRKYTLGVDVSLYDYTYENSKFRLNLWDCAGDNRYLGLAKNYISNSDLVMIFGNNKEEFENWITDNTPKIYVNSQELLSVTLNKIKSALH